MKLRTKSGKVAKANTKAKPKHRFSSCREHHNRFLKELNTEHTKQQHDILRPTLPPKEPLTIKATSITEINDSIDLLSKL